MHEHTWGPRPEHVEIPEQPAKRWCRECGLLQGNNPFGHNGTEWVDMGIIEAPEVPPALPEGPDFSKFPKKLGHGWWQLSNGVKLRSAHGDEAYMAQARLTNKAISTV